MRIWIAGIVILAVISIISSFHSPNGSRRRAGYGGADGYVDTAASGDWGSGSGDTGDGGFGGDGGCTEGDGGGDGCGGGGD